MRSSPRLMGERVLVIEDDRAAREEIVRLLVERGHEAEGMGDGDAALAAARSGHHSVVVANLDPPGSDHLALLVSLRALEPDAGILVVTELARAQTRFAGEALRLGALELLAGPVGPDEIVRRVESLARIRELTRENARLRQQIVGRTDLQAIVGSSPAMKIVREWIERAAAAASNVLVTGESGTGKELVARAIHAAGPLRDRPFLAVNVAAIALQRAGQGGGAVQADLFELRLFGHEKGAFSGAIRSDGALGAAAGGILFLDEVAELPLQAQAKLLGAIEEKQFFPSGSDRPVPAAVRVIAATSRDIETMVERGTFRDDLYYRLNVVRIRVPPLRERPADIPALAADLLRLHAGDMGRRAPSIEPEALQLLMAHEWKGNVRELSNVLERALLLCPDDRIAVEALPRDVATRTTAPPTPLRAAVADFERRHIAWVLDLAGGNRERAARLLGLSPATLYRRLDRLGLSRGRALNGHP
ncbi:MAG: sigma-54-dependent Fis family transcriptional regulator [Deltaproteobacteria bacterium]|nr:sigma-54-dependent Fis family transcriptional regulator [Deltaproteobacteria bacterium]